MRLSGLLRKTNNMSIFEDPDNEEVDIDEGDEYIPTPDIEFDDLEDGEEPTIDEDELE
jgi:hypothetical protein